MSARTLISVEDYLASCYEPDCDFVDGHIEERNVGEVTHARLQLRIGSYLLTRYENEGLVAMTEVRVQVRPARFRVPDVCVTVGEPGEEVLTKPPFICIEILSPEDTLRAMHEKAAEYRQFGVENIWIIDPEPRIAYRYTGASLEEVKTGELTVLESPIRVLLSEMFAELDR